MSRQKHNTELGATDLFFQPELNQFFRSCSDHEQRRYLIAFWVYDFMLPGPPHPYVGILIFLILPGFFVLGLLLIPLGFGSAARNCWRWANCLRNTRTLILRSRWCAAALLFVALATF